MSYKYNLPPNQLKKGTPIKDYLDSKDFREQRLWVMVDGILKTEYNGKLLTDQEFSEIHPVKNPITFLQGRENIDGTTNWINK